LATPTTHHFHCLEASAYVSYSQNTPALVAVKRVTCKTIFHFRRPNGVKKRFSIFKALFAVNSRRQSRL